VHGGGADFRDVRLSRIVVSQALEQPIAAGENDGKLVLEVVRGFRVARRCWHRTRRLMAGGGRTR